MIFLRNGDNNNKSLYYNIKSAKQKESILIPNTIYICKYRKIVYKPLYAKPLCIYKEFAT